MSSDPGGVVPSELRAAFGELHRNWGWLLALGIASIVLGTIGLGMTVWLTLASVLFFGVLILIGGVAQGVQAFQCRGWKSVVWHWLIALLYVLAGLVILADPLVASSVLTLVLAGAILASGLVRIVIALQMRGSGGWGWPLFSGIVSVALGAMIAARWPVSGLWVIGLFVALELLLNGWSTVIVALAARRAGARA